MKTVGNDIITEELQQQRKWYIACGIMLIIFGIILFGSLVLATLSVVYLFGVLIMIGGVIHIVAGFKLFKGIGSWLWALFGILYFVAGYYIFKAPITTAVILTNLLAFALIVAGIFRFINAFVIKPVAGWGWTLISGILTFITGVIILTSPDAPFWVLGLFLAVDILFQGINYLSLASAIKHLPHSSTTTS
ncbi:HdeD family acid-resistance protein [Acinetobacter sp. Colony158]|uniref:HdeD family acid-resistance protein n=1 Tax=Acinetobacter sp. Colony158 TaxID=2810070 RepID=UPI001C4C7786|nr:HdeD family acid-resistance protein [Acinetobacter sp. Colony158]